MSAPGLKERLRGWLSHDVHPTVQFVKYAAVGGLGTVVFGVAQVVGRRLLSAGRVTGGSVFDPAYLLANVPAFILSLAVVYPLNRMFVFRPGRHKSTHEAAYFFGFAILGNALGAVLASYLIKTHHMPDYFAVLGNIFTSVMVNYAGRKYFVFHG